MLHRKTINDGEHSATKYVPLPEHHRWHLGDFLHELREFYDADGGACNLEVYKSVECDSMGRTWYSSDNRIYKFHRNKGRDSSFHTSDLVTSDVMDLAIFCDFGFDVLGAYDVWYAYLADPDELTQNQGNDLVNAAVSE